MTRICVASSGLGHVARGIEAWADDLGHALAARGEDVILCKGDGRPESDFERVVPCWTRESRQARLLVNWIPRSVGWRIGFGSGYAVEQTTFARNLLRLLQEEDVDVLHVQDPHVAYRIQRACERGWIRTRTILAHGTEESIEFQARITYLQHLAPWHLEAARAAGHCRSTWTAVPNFIDTDRFRPGDGGAIRQELNIPQDAVMVLATAAIKRHHKRVDYLVREFRLMLDQCPEAPIWLVIAGGVEPETEAIVAEATQMLGRRVRFLVQFPRHRMPELYRAADVFTLGSLMEMMPIALLEALASGLPCVVHHHPVMSWMAGPGGVTADLSQPGGWVEAATPLLLGQLQRQYTGELGRQHCESNFSRDRVIDQILDYYEVVLHHDKPGHEAGARDAMQVVT